ADVQTVAADDIAVHLAHDHHFAGIDVGGNNAVPSNGDAVLGNIDGAFDAAVHIEGFGAADFTLDDQRPSDAGLLQGSIGGFRRCVGVEIAELSGFLCVF